MTELSHWVKVEMPFVFFTKYGKGAHNGIPENKTHITQIPKQVLKVA